VRTAFLGILCLAVIQSAAAQTRERAGLGLDLYLPGPNGREPARVIELGRRLFFDPILSRDSTVACVSCHKPASGFADSRSVSVGVFGRRGSRNVPAIINRGWGKAFFWDGRTTSLEEQVLAPIGEPAEMGSSDVEAVARLQNSAPWRAGFWSALGEEASRGALARALAAYVRSIQAGATRFDRAMLGDENALTPLEQRGLVLFQGAARCARCHAGALLTDESFHNTGIAWRTAPPADSGRARVTGRSTDIGAFKTPTLRQIGQTAPYMHDGSLGTLEEVIEFYDRGGHPNPYLDSELRPIGLSGSDKKALLAFLRSLDGRIAEGRP
jgi:cytochrome c peroxidase